LIRDVDVLFSAAVHYKKVRFCYNPRDGGGDTIRPFCHGSPWTTNYILFGEKDQGDHIIALYGFRYTVSAIHEQWRSTNWFLHKNDLESHLVHQESEDINIPGKLGMNSKSRFCVLNVHKLGFVNFK